MTLAGVDLSRYQAGISWPAVSAAGVTFSIARASIGTATDATFDSHTKGAQGQGMVAGAYHYLTAGDGSDQADVFVTATNACHGLLAALDCEASGITTALIHAFADRFAERTDGHPLFIYTGIAWWGQHGNPSLKDLGPLWLAYYPGGGYPGDSSPIWNTTLGGKTPTIWQFGPRKITGRNPVDGDAFRGTRAELEAYIGGTTQAPAGDPLATITIQTFETGPRLVSIPAGSTLAGYGIGADGTLHETVAAHSWPAGTSCHADATVTGSAFTGTYLRIVDGVYCPGGSSSVITSRGNTVAPPAAPDCDAAVEAATAPLEATIAAFPAQLETAKAAEHERTRQAAIDAVSAI